MAFRMYGQPTSTARNDGRMLLPNMRPHGSYQPTPNFIDLSPGLSSSTFLPATGATQSDHYGATTGAMAMGAVTLAYRQDLAGWRPGDTYHDCITFFINQGNHTTSSREVAAPSQSQMHKMVCLSALNYQLCWDKRTREMYSNKNAMAGILQDITFAGIHENQMTASEILTRGEHVMNLIVSGRHRIPNIFSACAPTGRGTSVRVSATQPARMDEGANLWLVCRRYPFTGMDPADPNNWSDSAIKAASHIQSVPTRPDRRELQFRTPWKEENVEAMLKADFAPDEVDKLEPPPQARTTPAADRYYWRWDPWVTFGKGPPPHEVYTGDRGPDADPDNDFVGGYLHIGVVTKILDGSNDRTGEQIEAARAVLYPTSRGTDWIKSLHRLDQIEVIIRAGTGLK